eukprot:Sdes_comp20477_c0_seq4m14785
MNLLFARRFFTSRRFFSSSSSDASLLTAKCLQYQEFGKPSQKLALKDFELGPIGPQDVLVEMQMAPINPADINMIEGRYPIRPSSFPAVGGNEGVGLVKKIGSKVKTLNTGEWVIPRNPGWGTWRTHAICDEAQLQKIPSDIPLSAAATLSVNPCTAYRMLCDFVDVKPGQVVIQNGSNCAVGQAVIQMAASRNFSTINVVRKRESEEENLKLKQYLTSLGNSDTYVVTEDFLRTSQMRQLCAQIGAPVLALNCVGGKSSTELVRLLADGGTMVTYGGMSKEPVIVPTGQLIFRNIKLAGFWLSQWVDSNSRFDRDQMFSEISGTFVAFHSSAFD